MTGTCVLGFVRKLGIFLFWEFVHTDVSTFQHKEVKDDETSTYG